MKHTVSTLVVFSTPVSVTLLGEMGMTFALLHTCWQNFHEASSTWTLPRVSNDQDEEEGLSVWPTDGYEDGPDSCALRGERHASSYNETLSHGIRESHTVQLTRPASAHRRNAL